MIPKACVEASGLSAPTPRCAGRGLGDILDHFIKDCKLQDAWSKPLTRPGRPGYLNLPGEPIGGNSRTSSQPSQLSNNPSNKSLSTL